MGKEKSELIQEALDTLQAVTLSGRSTEGYVAELFENIRNLEEENKKLKSDLAFERTMLDNVRAEYKSLQNVIRKLNEKVRFLEQCLDNKEKVNKSLREELEKIKSTYVYDAKQVRDIC